MEHHPRYKAEIDWPELLRQPWRLFGYSYIYLVVTLVGIGWLYLENVSTAGMNNVPSSVVQDSSALVTDVPLRSPRILPAVRILSDGVSSPELVARGRDLYVTQCASCHGESGMGDGPAGMVLNPRPRNFTSLSGWTHGSKVTGIYKTLEEGIVRNGMASYSYLPPLDRLSLAHYVRTFAQGQPLDTPEELVQLDAVYALSEEVNISGQIPLKRATAILMREAEPRISAVTSAAASQHAELFSRFAYDPVRALSTLTALRRRSATLEEVVRAVSHDPVRAGFTAGVSRLSAADWSLLYQSASSVR